MKSASTLRLVSPLASTYLALAACLSSACGGQLDSPHGTSPFSPAPPPSPPASPIVSGSVAVETGTRVVFYGPGALTGATPVGELDWAPPGYSWSNIAFDADGGLYIDCSSVGDDSGRIDVFAPGSVGAAAPVRTIVGPATNLADLRSLAVGADGSIYVACGGTGSNGGSVEVFAPYANGNVAPTRVITPANDSFWLPSGLALDAKGEVLVADSEDAPLNVFAGGARGPSTPIVTFGGSQLFQDSIAVALDAGGKIYVADWAANDVIVFGPDPSAAPVTLGGDQTGIRAPETVAVDHDGRIIVSSESGGSVRVFAPGAQGNATPVALLGFEGGSSVAIVP